MLRTNKIIFLIIGLTFALWPAVKISNALEDPFGYCKYHKPISVGGGDNYGEADIRRSTCLGRETWTAFCPKLFIFPRDQFSCSCIAQNEKGWPIEFFPGFDELNSPAFSQRNVASNCALPDNFNSADPATDLKSKQDAYLSWAGSVEGRRYATISSIDGCITHCRRLGIDCLFWFNGKSPDRAFTNKKIYIFAYTHPIFGSMSIDAKMITEFIKRNNEIIIQNGFPNHCADNQLKALLGWPADCAVSASIRNPSHESCADKPTARWREEHPGQTWKPSEHCKGQAIDISCGETWSNTPDGCGPKTTKALEIIQSYWSGKNIIQECTAAERLENRTEGTSDIIHFDFR